MNLSKGSKGEYAFATFMYAKKDIFGNWTTCQMHGDYRFVDKFNKYAMPLLEEIFDFIFHAKVLNILELQFKYHQLSFHEGDKMKIDQNEKNYLY